MNPLLIVQISVKLNSVPESQHSRSRTYTIYPGPLSYWNYGLFSENRGRQAPRMTSRIWALSQEVLKPLRNLGKVTQYLLLSYLKGLEFMFTREDCVILGSMLGMQNVINMSYENVIKRSCVVVTIFIVFIFGGQRKLRISFMFIIS